MLTPPIAFSAPISSTAGAPRPIVRALYSTKETEILLSISHAQLCRLIGASRLDARKIGSRTFITADSIGAFLASLPKVGEAT